jgi:DNA-directed RNA polymerase subunit RPC12/RpoP
MENLPICVNCGTEMRCVKNGAGLIRYHDGEPITVQSGDKYGCPDCSFQVMVGLGAPTHSGDKGFEGELSRAERNSYTVNVGEDYVFPK